MYKKHRKTIIAGNWKMNILPSEVETYIEQLRAQLPSEKSCEVILCVPFTHLSAIKEDDTVLFGAQNVSIYEKGAYTGEISADMLVNLGVRFVIVGHSECRKYHGDTDFIVGKKTAAVLKKGMSPIICVGESLEQRESGLTMAHISYQLLAALSKIPEGKEHGIVIAYEPIWAIGTGKTATPEEAQKVCKEIRAVLNEKFGKKAAGSISILYGGSMKANNAKELLSMPDIDGGLIGGASLKPTDFAQIIGAVSD